MLIFIDVAAGVDNIIFRMLQAGIIAKAVERIFRAVKSIFPAICFFSRIEPHHKLIATAYQPGAKPL